MSNFEHPKETERKEALKALDRVHVESETITGSTLARMADRAKDHIGATDKSEDDWVEVWGTRIGRGAGIVFAIGLVIYLAINYL